MAQLYELKLRKDFPAQSRRRAGIEIPAGPDGVQVELDDAQLAAVKADPEITVRKVAVEKTDDKADSKQMIDEPKGKKTA